MHPSQYTSNIVVVSSSWNPPIKSASPTSFIGPTISVPYGTSTSTPSTTEQEMSKGPSKFRKFVDSVIDFISDIINKAQAYLIAFFTDKEIVMNIKKINDIANKTRLKTSYQADTFGQTSPYVNKMFTTINMYKFNELIFTYYNKMVHDKEHAVDILKKYEEERKKLINSGDTTI